MGGGNCGSFLKTVFKTQWLKNYSSFLAVPPALIFQKFSEILRNFTNNPENIPRYIG